MVSKYNLCIELHIYIYILHVWLVKLKYFYSVYIHVLPCMHGLVNYIVIIYNPLPNFHNIDWDCALMHCLFPANTLIKHSLLNVHKNAVNNSKIKFVLISECREEVGRFPTSSTDVWLSSTCMFLLFTGHCSL